MLLACPSGGVTCKAGGTLLSSVHSDPYLTCPLPVGQISTLTLFSSGHLVGKGDPPLTSPFLASVLFSLCFWFCFVFCVLLFGTIRVVKLNEAPTHKPQVSVHGALQEPHASAERAAAVAPTQAPGCAGEHLPSNPPFLEHSPFRDPLWNLEFHVDL